MAKRESAEQRYLTLFDNWLEERNRCGDWNQYLRATGLVTRDIEEEAGIPRKYMSKGLCAARRESVEADLESKGVWSRPPSPDAGRLTGLRKMKTDDEEVERRDREIRRLKMLLAEKSAELEVQRTRQNRSIEALAPLGGRLFPPKEGD